MSSVNLYCSLFSYTMPHFPFSLPRALICGQVFFSILYATLAVAIKQESVMDTFTASGQCLGKLHLAPGWDALKRIIQTTYQSSRYISEKEFVATQKVIICGLAKYLRFMEAQQTTNAVIAGCTAASLGLLAAGAVFYAIRGCRGCCCIHPGPRQANLRPHRPAPAPPVVFNNNNPFLPGGQAGRPLPDIPRSAPAPVVAQPGAILAAVAGLPVHHPVHLAAMDIGAQEELADMEMEDNHRDHSYAVRLSKRE